MRRREFITLLGRGANRVGGPRRRAALNPTLLAIADEVIE
jgi:hypothetical protein